MFGWLNYRSGMQKDQEVLDYLADHPNSYGQQIANACRLNRGAIYGRLGRLEDAGYVRSRYEDPDPDWAPYPVRLLRRLYSLNEYRKREPAKEAQVLDLPLYIRNGALGR